MLRRTLSHLTTGLATTGLAVATLAGAAQAQDRQFVTVGTGGVTGVYYPAGGAMCRLMNQDTDRHNIRCTVESTAASVYNIRAVDQGDLEFGISQADWVYHAAEGNREFEDGALSDLRTVFSLHPESVTAVARADAEIESFADLEGKRVNIGDPGSGARATNEMLFEEFGLSFDDLALASELRSAEQAAALCDDNIDAYAWIVGHPSAGVSEATSTCEARLVPIEGEEVDNIIEDQPYYSKTTIPGGLYEGNPDDVATFGMHAVVVTSAEVDDDTVYEFTRAVFENLDEFRQMHPALANLEAEAMVSEGINAPIHDGAQRYYEEAGLSTE